MGERLQKILAARGVASRRKAEQWIQQGRVTINGKAAKAGTEVKAGDIIEIKFGENLSKYEVLSVQESVRKEDAAQMYRSLS